MYMKTLLKGGIVVSVKGIRVFVPASQTGLPRDADMSELLKKKVRLRITDDSKARFWWGEVAEVIEPSADRVTPPCPVNLIALPT